VGRGTQIGEVQQLFTQGAFQSTQVNTDLAIEGNGFLVLRGTHAGRTASFYTRAGQLRIDTDGYLADVHGLRVQGFAADADGNVQGNAGALTDLRLAGVTVDPRASENATMQARLDADAAVRGFAFDPGDLEGTTNFSTSVTVVDSLGRQHEVTVFFRKEDDASWSWHAMARDGELDATSVTPDALTEVATGTLDFDDTGRLTSLAAPPASLAFANAAPQDLTFDFTGTRANSIPGEGDQSALVLSNADGYTVGTLQYFQIGTDGRIEGSFTNGERRVLAQVALADFRAPAGLEKLGGTLYSDTSESGPPQVGIAGSAGLGTLVAGALEQSNVDMTREFVDLIALQRGFQANSRTITTSDQLLAEIVGMKR
jgi:flagellar hook protein FlgE